MQAAAWASVCCASSYDDMHVCLLTLPRLIGGSPEPLRFFVVALLPCR